MTCGLTLRAVHPEMGRRFPWPARMSAEAAGHDLVAAIDAPVLIIPGGRARIACGFAMALPAGYEAQIRPRSGLAARHGVTCLNAPGTIDADYRGEVQVLLVNHGDAAYVVAPGSRIAQMVIAAVVLPQITVAADLPTTVRGEGGFGSTGA